LRDTRFEPRKFSELVLYVAHRSEDDPRFGAVKLNKILYYADFNTYRRLGHPITGAEYQKLNEGPAPREMLSMRRTMLDSQLISIEFRPYFNGVQQRIVALREPDTSVFLPGELEIVDETISALWNMSARQASDLSHTEIGWKAAQRGEAIPYQTAWLSSDPIPQEAEEYWREKANSNAK
jgi:uncharacterized phage-associated protein